MSGRSFAAGETVVLQEVWRGRLWSARPAIVVADQPNLTAFWLPAGTRWKAATTPPTREPARIRGERLAQSLVRGDWILTDHDWDMSTLWVSDPGAGHAVGISWRPNGEFAGWYVNLQEPFRRTSFGFQWMDLMLDIIVAPDRTWRWKDEDELQLMVDHGVFDERLALDVREEGERVISRLRRKEGPFSDRWPEWRPNPAWTTPVLSPGWEQVEAPRIVRRSDWS